MAQEHNAIRYAADLLSSIGRAVGLSTDAEGTTRLGETLTPVMDPWRRPEMAFLRGERLGGFTADPTGGAAALGWAQIWNPVGSRFIVTLEWIIITSIGTTTHVIYTHSIMGTGTPIIGYALDSRVSQLTRLTASGNKGTDQAAQLAAPGNESGTLRTLANEPFLFPGPWIIAPGTGVSIVMQSVAIQSRYSFRFRERTAYPGELRS